jgi:phosphoglucosamine mutase
VKQSGQSLAELTAGMAHYPQTMVNVQVRDKIDLANAPKIQSAVARAEQQLGSRGRVVLRASGTEPVVRVMVEGDEQAEVNRLAEDIAASVRATATG